MAYVVTKSCIGTKDRSCVEVCPVDCFYNIEQPEYNQKFGTLAKKRKKLVNGVEIEVDDSGMLLIHPDECINCGACETECPVEAIFEDTAVPQDMQEFVDINSKVTLAMSDEELDKTRCTGKV